MRFSIFRLARESLSGHRRWPRHWRVGQPRGRHDVIVVGAGGHGLATAYHLAHDHGIRDVLVLERGWLGGGNTGRNTTVVRANYFFSPSAAFYLRSMQMFASLSERLNFNIMFSPRGLIQIAHSRHELESLRRWYNAMRLNGISAEWLNRNAVLEALPRLDGSPEARFPVHGGYLHHGAGIARHDAVAWGYARAASALGVQIVEQCPVLRIEHNGGRVTAVTTAAGRIECGAVVLAVAGRTSELARTAGLQLPIASYPLQAFVSEPVKPVLDRVVISGVAHVYLSQSDKGELVVGSDMDPFASYGQHGSQEVLERSVASLLALFPGFSRLRMLRRWAGTVDVTPDRSPILGGTSLDGLFLSAGWGTGGFKAIPAGGETLARTIATGRVDPLIRDFSLDRFAQGALVDEGAAASVAH